MMKKKSVDVSALIPSKLKVEYLSGDTAFKAQQVAAFTGIHPAILEMGKELIAKIGKTARFKLADAKMQEAGDAIQSQFVKGLRKVGKALSEESVLVKYGRDGDSLVFWFAKGWKQKKGS